MIIEREKPDILRLIYRQDKDDPNYGSCLWAIFDFDPGRGMLNIQSDCGNFAYRWPERGDMFLHMCGYFDKQYLIHKLCGEPKELDLEGTIENVREAMKDNGYEEDEIKFQINYLENEFEDHCCQSVTQAQHILDEWNSTNEIDLYEAWNMAEKEYSAHEIRIVEIYHDYIEPELRSMDKERKMDGKENEN